MPRCAGPAWRRDNTRRTLPWKAVELARLLGGDLDGLDQLAPLRDLGGDALAEGCGRAAAGIDAIAAEALDQLGRAYRAVAGGGELGDDVRRRSGWRHHADPQDALIAGHAELGDGREIRGQRRARAARDREHPELAGGHMRRRGRVGVQLELDLPGEEIGHRRRGALVGDMGYLD